MFKKKENVMNATISTNQARKKIEEKTGIPKVKVAYVKCFFNLVAENGKAKSWEPNGVPITLENLNKLKRS